MRRARAAYLVAETFICTVFATHAHRPLSRALAIFRPTHNSQAAASAASVASLASASGLVDAPIVAKSIQYLDGEGWTASNGDITIGARVPGDLVTDLEVAGVIGDPLYETNWVPMGVKTVPIWDATNWTYVQNFTLSGDTASAPNVWIVFDGIKMAADIWLNGAYLGFTNDQFLRYQWDVSSVVSRTGANSLQVTFTTSQDPRNAEARFMGCTGGWDWASYTNTATSGGTRTFTKGLWKSVSLVGVEAAAITHLVPLIYYNGTYPTSPLTDSTAGPWTVSVTTHFSAASASTGTLAVAGSFGQSASQQVSLPAGNSSVTLTLAVPAGAVSLWWPVGLGAQTLYSVNATFTPSAGGSAVLTTSRSVGFRTLYLVTVNDTSDPQQYSGQDGSGDFTMRFKVNGADIYSRGGNMIPLDALEGRVSAAAYTQMVQSAADGQMNTFRIWGGGIYYHDEFYDAADRTGIIMYHDAMYAGDGRVNPYGNDLEKAELQHQVSERECVCVCGGKEGVGGGYRIRSPKSCNCRWGRQRRLARRGIRG
jgi:beta-mannosidase